MLTLERKWDKRVKQWHSHVTSAVAFEHLLKDMMEIAAPRPADSCVDLGAGTGFVTMALAPLTSSVLAVDISSAMASALAERAAQDGLGNVSTQVADLSEFQLQPASSDLVVSSYALHHLVDADKRALVTRSAQWLRPGGRLVIGDMMFGRGASQRDRDILQRGHGRDQMKRLENDADLTAPKTRQCVLIEGIERGSVDHHLSAVGTLQSRHHHEERRFS